MIITSLNGGLGNQLFQYALGRRLSYERNVPLRFDLSSLEIPISIRQYKLDFFQVQGKPINDDEKNEFYRHKDSRLFSLLQKSLPYYRRRIVVEKALTFDENILYAPSKVLLQGYWQSQKYFAPIRPLLQKEFQLKTPLDIQNQYLVASIQGRNSVSVHIRRGDYVSNPEANKAHGVLPLSHYKRALMFIKENVVSPHFFIFSDDITWARENIKDLECVTFVDHNGPDHDYFDLMLMKECKFHITANSSFSWWAAWLSDYKNKLVIVPKKWYQADWDTRDLLPGEWIKI